MEIAGIDPELVARVERETTELLSALIRIDTSNPPGNESAVAAFLDDYFRRHGLRGEIVGEPAERRSFVVSLTGSRPGPPARAHGPRGRGAGGGRAAGPSRPSPVLSKMATSGAAARST